MASDLGRMSEGAIVTPPTYSRWVRELREGRRPKSVGRPKVARNVRELAVRLAKENAGWGYRRIVGELRKLRLLVSRMTVRRMLCEAGLTPSPQRRGRAEDTVWGKFIQLHLNTLVACDFFPKSVVNPLGRHAAYCLAFIHVGTRKVLVSPATLHPDERWVQQQARNALMWLEENGLQARFVLHDRDAKFSAGFERVLANAGVKAVRTPRLAPNANAFAEAWIGSLKRECLNHFMCFSLRYLEHIVRAYVSFYNQHRPHQGLGNRTIDEATTGPPPAAADESAQPCRIRSMRILGGLLRHYYRVAA